MKNKIIELIHQLNKKINKNQENNNSNTCNILIPRDNLQLKNVIDKNNQNPQSIQIYSKEKTILEEEKEKEIPQQNIPNNFDTIMKEITNYKKNPELTKVPQKSNKILRQDHFKFKKKIFLQL